MEKNVCEYLLTGMSNSAACYKGLYTVGYESDGNQYFPKPLSADCGSTICAIAEHCDTCINADVHDNFYSHAATCVRMEVNQDDNVHDNRCISPTEQGFIISTREGQGTSDTVTVNQLTGTTNLCTTITCSPNVALNFASFPGTATNTCPGSNTTPVGPWTQTNAVTLTLTGGPTTGLLVTQDLGSPAQTWVSSPILEICIESTVAINAGSLQFVLSNTGSLSSPHTTINLPGLQASTWIPVYVLDDAFGLNFTSGRGVRSWGINGLSVPNGTIGISVFIHDVPFARHNIHGNHVVRSGDKSFYLAGGLQDFDFYGNFCVDPGFSQSGANHGCIRLDPVTFNAAGGVGGFFSWMFSGQIHDNHFTNNGGASTRRGADYNNDSNHPINKVRTFHNFFSGSFANTVFYNNTGNITDAYYVVSGTQALTMGSATVTFPANGFSTLPCCTATDQTAANAVKALPTATTLGLSGNGTDTIAYQCRSQNVLFFVGAVAFSTDGG